MDLDILNGDGWLNTEISRIASDNFRPGAIENVDLNITNGLDFRLENIYAPINVSDYIDSSYPNYFNN